MKVPAEHLQIRRMVAGDLSRVMEIAESLPGAPHWTHAAYLDALKPKAVPQRIALVAVEADEVCGFTIASLISPQAELETIAVAAKRQRRGLASQLFGALVGELRAAGVGEALLEVRASNRTALAFYQSLGFSETGRRRGYYADPIEDAVLMKLLIE